MICLSKKLIKKSGRNSSGKITVRHRGGGHSRRFRFINLKQVFLSLKGIIYKKIYDPNRNVSLHLVLYENGLFGHIISYENIKIGDVINNKLFLSSGSNFYLKDLPSGSIIHNVELHVGKGGQIARSSGSFCQIINKYVHGLNLILVKFVSGDEYLLNYHCKASLGSVYNESKRILTKAGHSRWVGNRPRVRGVAMNPVDHPHGGGEGKTSGGRPSVSFKGVITKGKPTRSVKKINPFILKYRK